MKLHLHDNFIGDSLKLKTEDIKDRILLLWKYSIFEHLRNNLKEEEVFCILET